MKKLVPICFAAFLIFNSQAALATLAPIHDVTIRANGQVAQDGFNVTLDNATGLEWLDITLSTGWSYNDIEAASGAGGEFQGWNHASIAELNQLFFDSAGISSTTVPVPMPPADPQALTLQNLVGKTFDDGSFAASTALLGLGDSGNGSSPSLGEILYLRSAPGASAAYVIPGTGSFTDMNANSGHWLVRHAGTGGNGPGGNPAPNAVPEPASLIIWLVFGAATVLRLSRSKR